MAHPTRGVGARARARTAPGPGHRTGSAARGRAGVGTDRSGVRNPSARTGESPVARGSEPAPGAPLGKAGLAALRSRLAAVIEPVVAREGVDLEDITVTRMGRRYLVRVTVDADGGVGHDELSEVSRAVSDALDEAEERSGEITPGPYTLEVSSPGVDRPLTQPRHWHRNVGRLVAVRVAGRPVTGRVVATDAHGVSLDVDGRRIDAAFDDLGPGRVQVEFTRLAELTDEEFGDVEEPDDEYSGPAIAGDGREG
ncbi:MAG: ribosome maturation factor RimP [Micromonosporaceae bacterium]|nr:ribosome maturation factor RimP [Micromonosporaceae bacterium]